MKICTFICLGIILSGCTSTARYQKGYDTGLNDFQRIKQGKSTNAWAAGYMSGFRSGQAADEYNQAIKKLDRYKGYKGK